MAVSQFLPPRCFKFLFTSPSCHGHVQVEVLSKIPSPLVPRPSEAGQRRMVCLGSQEGRGREGLRRGDHEVDAFGADLQQENPQKRGYGDAYLWVRVGVSY